MGVVSTLVVLVVLELVLQTSASGYNQNYRNEDGGLRQGSEAKLSPQEVEEIRKFATKAYATPQKSYFGFSFPFDLQSSFSHYVGRRMKALANQQPYSIILKRPRPPQNSRPRPNFSQNQNQAAYNPFQNGQTHPDPQGQGSAAVNAYSHVPPFSGGSNDIVSRPFPDFGPRPPKPQQQPQQPQQPPQQQQQQQPPQPPQPPRFQQHPPQQLQFPYHPQQYQQYPKRPFSPSFKSYFTRGPPPPPRFSYSGPGLSSIPQFFNGPVHPSQLQHQAQIQAIMAHQHMLNAKEAAKPQQNSQNSTNPTPTATTTFLNSLNILNSLNSLKDVRNEMKVPKNFLPLPTPSQYETTEYFFTDFGEPNYLQIPSIRAPPTVTINPFSSFAPTPTPTNANPTSVPTSASPTTTTSSTAAVSVVQPATKLVGPTGPEYFGPFGQPLPQIFHSTSSNQNYRNSFPFAPFRPPHQNRPPPPPPQQIQQQQLMTMIHLPPVVTYHTPQYNHQGFPITYQTFVTSTGEVTPTPTQSTKAKEGASASPTVQGAEGPMQVIGEVIFESARIPEEVAISSHHSRPLTLTPQEQRNVFTAAADSSLVIAPVYSEENANSKSKTKFKSTTTPKPTTETFEETSTSTSTLVSSSFSQEEGSGEVKTSPGYTTVTRVLPGGKRVRLRKVKVNKENKEKRGQS